MTSAPEENMAMAKNHVIEETQIREMMDDWVQAFQAKDLDRIMEHYADDITAFDLMPPLRFQGKDAYRKLWEEAFRQMEGSISIEFQEEKTVLDEEVAYSHYLTRFRGKQPNGEDMDVWSRSTMCFCKIEGKWLITHEHDSVPIDMNSGKGLMDLKP
jgi:uncharacterized protein (TIGR02246 family)